MRSDEVLLHHLAYRISTLIGPLPVDGHAMQLPTPWSHLRLCVREGASGWIIDHYPSGLRVPSVEPAGTRDEAIAALLDWLPRATKNEMALMERVSHPEQLCDAAAPAPEGKP